MYKEIIMKIVTAQSEEIVVSFFLLLNMTDATTLIPMNVLLGALNTVVVW